MIGYFLYLPWSSHINMSATWGIYFLELSRSDAYINLFDNSFTYPFWIIHISNFRLLFHFWSLRKFRSTILRVFAGCNFIRGYVTRVIMSVSCSLMHAYFFFEYLSLFLLPSYRTLQFIDYAHLKLFQLPYLVFICL
jgi:hypothetical protein